MSPPQVFDDLVDLAGLRRGSRVLEIGPGTGQATCQLAQRGLTVLGLELGPRLADRARVNLADFASVSMLTTAFEDWDPAGEMFDAVFSCNAFHRIDPHLRFAKPAAVLVPGGHLIVLATPWVIPDDADRFWWDIQDDYAAIGSERVDPATKHPDRVSDISAALLESGYFDRPVSRRYRFDVEFTTGGLPRESGDPVERQGIRARRAPGTS